MQASIIISILLNVVLGILVLSKVIPSLYKVYMNKKKKGERQREIELSNKIKEIVTQYLKELQND